MSTILVTGANRGIGLALTRHYSELGWQVHACCRNPDKATGLKDVPAQKRIHRLDVTDGLQMRALARELAGEPIDVLVNNAGLSGKPGDLGSIDFDGWQQVFAVNVFAPLRMSELFREHIRSSERKLILNMSSVMGSIAENASGGSYIYRASKAALNMIGRGLATDLREDGITVLMVHPGWVCTAMGGPQASLSPDDSASHIAALIESADPAQTGRFLSYDGRELPW